MNNRNAIICPISDEKMRFLLVILNEKYSINEANKLNTIKIKTINLLPM